MQPNMHNPYCKRQIKLDDEWPDKVQLLAFKTPWLFSLSVQQKTQKCQKIINLVEEVDSSVVKKQCLPKKRRAFVRSPHLTVGALFLSSSSSYCYILIDSVE